MRVACTFLYADFTFNLKLVAVSSPALGRTPDRANSSPVTRFTPLIQRPTGACAGVDDVCLCVCVCVCVCERERERERERESALTTLRLCSRFTWAETKQRSVSHTHTHCLWLSPMFIS